MAQFGDRVEAGVGMAQAVIADHSAGFQLLFGGLAHQGHGVLAPQDAVAAIL